MRTPPDYYGPTATLSARELEIAHLIVGELQTREIAMQLGLAHATIKNRTHDIFCKLGVRGRVGVAVWLTRQEEGLLHPPS